jgi:hypothetical protein
MNHRSVHMRTVSQLVDGASLARLTRPEQDDSQSAAPQGEIGCPECEGSLEMRMHS